MSSAFWKKIWPILAAAAALFFGVKYLLPVMLPFLLGAGLALAAEPLVGRVSARFPRGISAGLGVSVTLVAVVAVVSFVGALAVGQLKKLAVVVPGLQDTAGQAMVLAQDFLVSLSEKAPESLRPMLQRTVLNFFDDGSVLLQQLSQHIPGFLGTALGRMGDGVLGLGTGLIAAFLISVRLPRLKELIRQRLPQSWHTTYQPALLHLRRSLGGWLKAQLKLSAVTWGIVAVGFVVLRIPNAILWSGLVAVVDAVPILGTGTVLLPWALICFLQGESLRCIGLLCTYGAAALTRTVLEPRLVGRQLGVDPLVMLIALYVGYRFWGILGMLFLPILASAAVSLLPRGKTT